jgi:molybdopterin molybdotransferase
MLSVEEAHARLMELFEPMPAEVVPLEAAASRVLARDAVATRDQPPFAASAMDGYALRAADRVPGARLTIVGEAAAGSRFPGAVGPGDAVRIFTGAPMPEGADAVLIQEDAEVAGEALVVREGVGHDRHVRPAGHDFAAGDRLAAPRRIGAAEIALLAAMNLGDVPVFRRPIVALIPTGAELVWPGTVPGPDQIVTSNNFGLKAMLEAEGAEVRLLPIADDTVEGLDGVMALAEGADLVVTLGGASVGDHDLVRHTAMRRGLDLAFYKVAMRPGKPLMAGRLRGTPFVGLPGNPVSAIVCGRIFLVPAVRRMLGLEGGLPGTQRGVLASGLDRNGPRAHYMRANVTWNGDSWSCTPFERQDSALLSVLSAANALVVRRPGDAPRRCGETVEFLWL